MQKGKAWKSAQQRTTEGWPAASLSSRYSDSNLKRRGDREENRKGRRQTAMGLSRLWSLKAVTLTGRNEAQIRRSKEAGSAGHRFIARTAEACSDAGSDVSPGKRQRTGAKKKKKKLFCPKGDKLHTALKVEGFRMRMICSGLCDRSQKKQMVTFFANSEQRSHRRGIFQPRLPKWSLGDGFCAKQRKDDLLSLKSFRKFML